MSKKGALNLGISTIVVLVIAMVLIAGFVSFIRNFLDAGEDSLMGAFDVAEFGQQPDAQNPIVIGSGSITIGQQGDDTKIVAIGYYNSGGDTAHGVKINKTVSCAEGHSFNITSTSFDSVAPGDSVGFQTILRHSDEEDGLNPQNYVCDIEIIDEDDKSLANINEVITVIG